MIEPTHFDVYESFELFNQKYQRQVIITATFTALLQRWYSEIQDQNSNLDPDLENQRISREKSQLDLSLIYLIQQVLENSEGESDLDTSFIADFFYEKEAKSFLDIRFAELAKIAKSPFLPSLSRLYYGKGLPEVKDFDAVLEFYELSQRLNCDSTTLINVFTGREVNNVEVVNINLSSTD